MDQLVTETASNLLSLFRSGFLKYIDCKQSKIVAQFWEYEENASCDSNVTLMQRISWVFVHAFQVSANLENQFVTLLIQSSSHSSYSEK